MSKSETWGGIETLIATMRMHRVNICFLNEGSKENGFLFGFNQVYKRCIILVYRKSKLTRGHYDHYDSVYEIDRDVLKIFFNENGECS